MENAARIVMGLYGLAMLAGGMAGYAKAGSKPSLIAGISSAILMAVAFFLSRQQPKLGFGIAAGTGVVLAIVFIRRIMETGKMMPNAALCGLSAGVAIFFVVALIQSGK